MFRYMKKDMVSVSVRLFMYAEFHCIFDVCSDVVYPTFSSGSAHPYLILSN